MSLVRVYIDFEFSDFLHRDIISVGVISEHGKTFYQENSEAINNLASEWVKINVYPLLESNAKIPLNELSARLWCWLEEIDADEIQIVADYQGDYDLLVELLGDEHPKIRKEALLVYNAFASTCFTRASFTGNFEEVNDNYRDAKEFYFIEFIGWFSENQLIQHHALNDAKAIKYAFEKTVNEFSFLETLRNV